MREALGLIPAPKKKRQKKKEWWQGMEDMVLEGCCKNLQRAERTCLESREL
jgi:hypothetical protein